MCVFLSLIFCNYIAANKVRSILTSQRHIWYAGQLMYVVGVLGWLVTISHQPYWGFWQGSGQFRPNFDSIIHVTILNYQPIIIQLFILFRPAPEAGGNLVATFPRENIKYISTFYDSCRRTCSPKICFHITHNQKFKAWRNFLYT